MRLSTLLICAFVSLNLSAQRSSADQPRPANARTDDNVANNAYRTINLATAGSTTTDELLEASADEFGLADGDELRVADQRTGVDGAIYYKIDQFHDGIPVFGTRLTLRTDGKDASTSVAGHLAPATAFLPTSPAPALVRPKIGGNAAPDNSRALPKPAQNGTYTEAELGKKAKASLHDKYPHVDDWNVTTEGETWISGTPWNANAHRHRARAIVVEEPGGMRAERVFVSMETGKTIFHHQLHCDLRRELYHVKLNPTPTYKMWVEGNAFPGALDDEDQEMLNATADIYNLMKRTFNRLGYDGQDAPMRMVSKRAGDCPNASANRISISHCPGMVTDDIVGHEWMHNYTTAMSGAQYFFETGAISEALSDIFGESIDILNGRGTDDLDQLPRTGGCNETNKRWLLGEDATAGQVPLRDMYQPECKGSPGARNSASFKCNDITADFGGVHYNSGVVNKTYSLLVDGGSRNGVVVAPIGMTKALHLFFHANNNYITPVTDFRALADMLLQSTEDLYGVNLPALTLLDVPTMASGEVLTPADRLQVVNALTATGMLEINQCASTPTLAQNPPAGCGETDNREETILLMQDWEKGMAGWTLSQHPVNPATWTDQPWTMEKTLPDGRAGQGVFAADPRIGDCKNDLENGTTDIVSPRITVPADMGDFQLRFNHYYSTEFSYDGGILEISRDGSDFEQVPESAFVYNGYDGPLEVENNDNPHAGKPAFHGSDQARLTGTWGTSVVDLAAAGAAAGDEIQLRWSLTLDGCNGWLGWYLDEVTVTNCVAAALPVSWVNVAAEAGRKHIDVSWTTEAETENAGFELERSVDGRGDFEKLGFVAASGANRGDYAFADHRALAGEAYIYRIKQLDFDGSFAYSPLVAAKMAGDTEDFRAYPNPARDRLTVETSASDEIAMYSLDGRLLQARTANNGRASFELAGLPAGVYLLRVGAKTRRIVVQGE